MSFYKGNRSCFAFLLPCEESELISAKVVFYQDNVKICEVSDYEILEDTITFELSEQNSALFNDSDRDLNERKVSYQFQYTWQPSAQNEVYKGTYPIQDTKCKRVLT